MNPVPRSGRRRATGRRTDARIDTLVAWFLRHRRPLPWRQHPNPYRIWVAEVMLQQTRVAQATPYYRRFVRTFPTIRALANASEEDVLRVWEGAGYYARARNLRRAAQQLVRAHAGKLPATPRELARLPGVGPYIAHAVASIAFGAPVPALEANALRVLARWTLERRNPRAPEVRRRFYRWVSGRIPRDRPGRFNEALMELGETICLPRNPLCSRCPVAAYCRARQELPDPGAIPAALRARRKPRLRAAVGVIEHGGRWLVLRRSPSGLLGGLWEFPGGKLRPRESPRAGCRREVEEETGIRVEDFVPAGLVRHSYSHFSVTLHVFRAELPRRPPVRTTDRPARWVRPVELLRLPAPRATRKIVALVTRRERSEGRAFRDSGSRPDRRAAGPNAKAPPRSVRARARGTGP